MGFAVTPKFQPRELFLTGVFVVALGFVCLWQLPRLIAALATPEARVQLEGPLLIIGLVISAFLFVCGFQVMGHCQWVREDEASDRNRVRNCANRRTFVQIIDNGATVADYVGTARLETGLCMEVDDDVRHLALQGKRARAIQLLRSEQARTSTRRMPR